MPELNTREQDKNARGAFAAATPVGPAVNSVKPAPQPAVVQVGLKANLLQSVNQYPFQIANLGAVGVTTLILTGMAALNLFRGAPDLLEPSQVIGALGGLITATYGLLATQAIAGFRADKENKANALKTEARLAETEASEKRLEQQIELLASENARQTILLQDLAEAMVGLTNKERPQAICQPNTVKCWSNLAPGSDYYSVAGKLWGDVWAEMLPDRSSRLVADLGRLIEAWLPRFRAGTAVRSANYVLFVRKADMAPGRVADAIRYHLFAFRVLRQLAAARGETLHLDRIRIAIRQGDTPPLCYFVGEYQHKTSRMPFTASYLNNADVFKVQRGVWDDSVTTNYAPDMVAANLHNAKAMMASAPVYSLDELEARFGSMVEHPQLGLPPAPPPAIDWVHNGDHFG